MQLYRKEIYDLKVMEIKKTDSTYNIKIHVKLLTRATITAKAI